MRLPVLSVVIPTHNRHERLAETVAGLRSQTVSIQDYEIVIVDDGSTPPVTILPETNGPACRLIRLEGLERSAARNAGAEAARGELLVFVDDDVSAKTDFLQAHLLAAKKWPGALLVGAIRLPAPAMTTPFGRFRQRLEDAEVPREAGPISQPNFCAAGNMAMPRSRFQELHGFDQRLVSSEDQDLALRHTAAGGLIVFVPQALVVHHDSALDIRSYCRRNEWGSAQMIPFCRRYPAMPENIARERINGPMRWGREPPFRSARKLFKALLARRPVMEIFFWIASVLERKKPDSRVLERVYRLLLGGHIFRGYRKGLRHFMADSEVVAPVPSPLCSGERAGGLTSRAET